ncbi:PPE family protein [Mycobacterium sp. 1274756.6]|uniref:PPE family protein n=1 Tax=Mycobacterium sp. 1274756.6 TaxID=1834076 RepID=UPI0007FFBF55|nr:PPE family protein [Mycobacterium sp. 1274756.6]OBJ69086.1 hypothetical protein A5643_12690 [Mycobacterium sp. 1274756.6]
MAPALLRLDFSTRAPEINAALIHGGDGSATMQAAAAAWDGLSANLQSSADAYTAVLTRLTTEEWLGPSAAAMAAKVVPHTAWLNAAAGRAEQTAAQARAAAAAFDAALAATTPPPVIAANRAQLRTLLETNALGLNTAAIMATEAQYLEMWAQCAAALHGYAAAAAAATRLQPVPNPRQRADPAGSSDETTAPRNAVRDAGSAVTPGLSDSPADGGWLADPGGAGLGPNANIWNTLASTDMLNPAMVAAIMADLATVQEFNEAAPGAFAPGSYAPVAPALSTQTLVSAAAPAAGSTAVASAPASTPAVTAGMGRATPLGALSVPANWAATAPAGATTGLLPGHSPAATPAGGHGAPGVPLAGAARGGETTGPRYGVRPTVMARPPAAGYGPELL